jgi:hypothetical protein
MTRDQMYNHVLNEVFDNLVKETVTAITALVLSADSRGTKKDEAVKNIRANVQRLLIAVDEKRTLLTEVFNACRQEA